VQTSPQGRSDLGRCEAAFYSVTNGLLTMRDENGTPTGKSCGLGPGDDERVIASRLKLAEWRNGTGTSDFNRRLEYSRHGVA
jgi:hypothetical protein